MRVFNIDDNKNCIFFTDNFVTFASFYDTCVGSATYGYTFWTSPSLSSLENLWLYLNITSGSIGVA